MGKWVKNPNTVRCCTAAIHQQNWQPAAILIDFHRFSWNKNLKVDERKKYFIFYFKNALKVDKLLDRLYEWVNSETNRDLIWKIGQDSINIRTVEKLDNHNNNNKIGENA